MNLSERIEQAPACQVINLTEPEREIYSGAGWKLARFEDGRLVELFDPLDQVPAGDDASETATAALDASIKWATVSGGEIYMVECSCYQLCEPQRFDPLDASAVARLGRRIGEMLSDYGF